MNTDQSKGDSSREGVLLDQNIQMPDFSGACPMVDKESLPYRYPLAKLSYLLALLNIISLCIAPNIISAENQYYFFASDMVGDSPLVRFGVLSMLLFILCTRLRWLRRAIFFSVLAILTSILLIITSYLVSVEIKGKLLIGCFFPVILSVIIFFCAKKSLSHYNSNNWRSY